MWSTSLKVSREQLLATLDQAYDRRSWHGTNLRGSLRGVTARQASWRPAPKRHNIWEEMVHAAYWKYVAWRRLTGEKRGSFALKGSNWFTRPALVGQVLSDLPDRAWRADLSLLARTHRLLRDAIERAPQRDLDRHAHLLTGIVAHDLYHAGQIQLLKKLAR